MPNDPAADRANAAALARTALGARHTGAVVGERYRLEKQLGRGGMGIVFAAVHLHTQRNVALKLIHCAWDDEALELYRRFLGEARAASAVRHRNVVDVLDMGYHGGAPFLVMERLVGESLEQVLDRLEVLSLSLLLEWLLPVMGALAMLHQKGIVHRDIKPSNIFLARDEAERVVPKLLDFGLARGTGEAPLTEPGVMLGTPEYMAPERVRGQNVGPLADVWAMGVVLFECLCGKLPFTATNLNGVAAQVVAGEVLKVHAVNPQVPEGVAAVVDRALSFVPEERHPDMASFAYALALAAQRSGATLPEDPDPVGLPNFGALHVRGDPWASGPMTIAIGTPTSALPQPVGSASSRHPRTTLRRRSRNPMLAFALLMALAGVASWSLLERKASVQPVPAPPVISPLARTAAPLDTRAGSESAPTARPAETPAAQGDLPTPSVPQSVPPNAPSPASESPLARAAARFDTAAARAPRTNAPNVRRVDVPVPPKHGPATNERAAPRRAPTSSNEFEKEWM